LIIPIFLPLSIHITGRPITSVYLSIAISPFYVLYLGMIKQ
jgi:hypothetical protein